MNAAPTLGELAGRVLAGQALDHAVRLAFGDMAVDVLVNQADLAQDLARYFQDFPRPGGQAGLVVLAVEAPAPEFGLELIPQAPGPGKTRIKDHFARVQGGHVARKPATGLAFLFGGELNLVVGRCRANVNQVVNFINNRVMERLLAKGWLMGHASAVAWRGRGLALAGFSGAGKSTLALAMLDHGLDFVSNDRVLVGPGHPGPMLRGLAKLPRVNPGTLLANSSLARVMPPADRRQAQALAPESLWSLERKYDVSIAECYGPGRFVLEAELAGLAVLTWKRGQGAARVDAVDLALRPDLLAALMKDPGPFASPGSAGQAPTLEAWSARLAGTTVLEVSGGADFPGVAARLAGFLKGVDDPGLAR